MFDWVILGGGIHGTYLSNFLLKTTNADAGDLLVVDPHDEPLSLWKQRTAITGMQYLRSPGEHNLDVGAGSLMRFADKRSAGHLQFYSRYQRPSLNIFNRHCDNVIKEQELDTVRLKASALSIARCNQSYVVATTEGDVECKRLILSLGQHDCLSIPGWAEKKELESAPVAHVFSKKFLQLDNGQWSKAVVVGGGISAVQLALRLAREKPGQVTLLHHKKFQSYQFDADPCWLDNRCLTLLKGQTDLSERRRIIDHARHLGSIPEDVRRQLDASIKNETLICIEAIINDVSGDDSSVNIRLASGQCLCADLVVLATGFKQCAPGGKFIAKAINDLSLKCAPCGYPQLDEYLQWSKNLFVTGPLAELVLGPASRNIIGARMASKRILVSESRLRTINAKEKDYYFMQRRRG